VLQIVTATSGSARWPALRTAMTSRTRPESRWDAGKRAVVTFTGYDTGFSADDDAGDDDELPQATTARAATAPATIPQLLVTLALKPPQDYRPHAPRTPPASHRTTCQLVMLATVA
jgi:hypothetical protein